MRDLSNQFESLSIKKNGLGNYILYGLMWWTFELDGKKTKSLVSVKSNNLKWQYDINISQNIDYAYCYGGISKNPLGSYISGMTRKLLYNFCFENIMSDDVLVELTVLNDGKDGFMKYNIYEGLDSYIVKINVAGVKKEEIRVVLGDGIVKVRTNPKIQEIEDTDTKLEMFEPIRGDVEIYLPNIESVEAKLEDGILTLTAPKESRGVKIEIN